MTDFSYKKYSLENLENWLHDAISCGEASPHEIYSTIRKVVQENHNIYKEKAQQCFGLLELLSGHRPVDFNENCEKNEWNVEEVLKEKEYYEPSMPPWGYSDMEYLKNKSEIDIIKKQVEENGGFDWTPRPDQSKSDHYYEYDRNDLNRPNPFTDKVTNWVLPVNVDGLTGDCYINLPDDLLERAGLQEGDMVEWIDRKDGSFEMRKVNGTK